MSDQPIPPSHNASKQPTDEGLDDAPCCRLRREREVSIAKLSAMHDQFCACTGTHPNQLGLTPKTATMLGLAVGHYSPWYAVVVSITESQDMFIPDNA